MSGIQQGARASDPFLVFQAAMEQRTDEWY